jgi:hypothetical protein
MAFAPKQVGRIEKRLPIAIVVHLAQVQDHQPANGTELTYTANISAHGACVLSSCPWRLGEVVEVTSLKDQITLRGKVVHCQKHSDDRYGVGLTFNERNLNWSTYNAYAGA